MKKRVKDYLNETINIINIKDIITLLIIVFLYAILSFYKLGDKIAPQTFYELKKNDEITLELNATDDIIRMKLYVGRNSGKIDLYGSEDGLNYNLIDEYIPFWTFAWQDYRIASKAKYLKITVEEDISIGEIGLYNNNKEYIKMKVISKNNQNEENSSITDESNTIPDKVSYMNSAYFDEYYFARAAYEYVNGYSSNEWTHPPLGKIIEAIPIFVTDKMTPFNYRLMGNLAGIALIGVMYIFAAILFKKRKYAIFASLLMFLDTFHFAQTRMGTVDSHLVLFITLGIMFMYLFVTKNKIRYLILSGLFFSLSVSIKWTGLYDGIALSIMYFTYLIKNKKINIKYLLLGTLLFVVLPLSIYTSIYFIFSNNYYKTNNIKNIILEQKEMYNFHSKNNHSHDYSSKWYTWPISYKPVWMHATDYPNKIETISGVGNLVIWIMGIIAFIYMIIKLFIKKDNISFYLITPILSLWIPYAFIPREMFLYHYFPVLPFLFLGVTYFIKDIKERYKLNYILSIYIIFCTIFFIKYYPVVSGKETEIEKLNRLELFDTWVFNNN